MKSFSSLLNRLLKLIYGRVVYMIKFSKGDIELFIHYFKCNRIRVHEKDMIFEDVYKEFLEYDFDYIVYYNIKKY